MAEQHSIDIFIKSYSKDFHWLRHSLNSIKRNVTGYNKVILLIPEHEKHMFDAKDVPDRTEIHYVLDEGGNGYLRQQYFKLTAYKYSFAEFILFGDSDCFFDHKIDLQEFVRDGKPEILYTDWSKVGDAICWKEPTERAMGEEVKWEFMRRNCMIYYRQTLMNINEWKPNLESIVMGGEKFSEFNFIGAYAYKFERNNYTFINTDFWTWTDPKATQIWSWCNKDEGTSETHLREYIRTLEAIMKCNGIEI